MASDKETKYNNIYERIDSLDIEDLNKVISYSIETLAGKEYHKGYYDGQDGVL